MPHFRRYARRGSMSPNGQRQLTVELSRSGAMAQVNGTARETPQKTTIMDVLKCKLTAWATRSATVGISGGPGSTIVLWYVHPSHRRRKVAARRLPIADSRAYRGGGAKSGWGCTHWKAPPCHGAHRGVHYDAFNAAFGNLLQINDLPANPTQGP